MQSSLVGKFCWFVAFLGIGCASSQPESSTPSTGPDSPGVSQTAACGDLRECESQCAREDAASCEWAGRMYETGEGAPQDYSQAAAMYEQACAGGREQACAHLAMMYDIGLAVEEDAERANTLYKKACEQGNKWACRRGQQLEK